MGIKGYNHPGKKHPVVSLDTDGSVLERFAFIKDAVAKYGMDRHSITKSCRHGKVCHGWRWMYEEDYERMVKEGRQEELRYTRDPNRDPTTNHFVKGHKMGNGRDRMTEETKERLRGSARDRMTKLHREGRVRHHRKAVVCLTDGQVFPSIKVAADFYGLRPNTLSTALSRKWECKGRLFRRCKEDEELWSSGTEAEQMEELERIAEHAGRSIRRNERRRKKE